MPVITPCNAQVREIGAAAAGCRVGAVDKFQGQKAPISICSMAASSAADAPRGMEFIDNLNRLNVTTGRTRRLAVVPASPNPLSVSCRIRRRLRLSNAPARFLELAEQRQ